MFNYGWTSGVDAERTLKLDFFSLPAGWSWANHFNFLNLSLPFDEKNQIIPTELWVFSEMWDVRASSLRPLGLVSGMESEAWSCTNSLNKSMYALGSVWSPLCPSMLSSLHSHSSDGQTEDQMKILKLKLVNREQGFNPSLLGSKQAPLDIIQAALTTQSLQHRELSHQSSLSWVLLLPGAVTQGKPYSPLLSLPLSWKRLAGARQSQPPT